MKAHYFWQKKEIQDPEFEKERKEHPTFSDSQVRQIVQDHQKAKK